MTDDFVDDFDGFEPDPLVAINRAQQRAKEQQDAEARNRERFLRLKQSYSAVFVAGNATAEDVQAVMNDLAWFCNAFESGWKNDPREQDRYTARREVFQRIIEYTKLDFETLLRRYMNKQ